MLKIKKILCPTDFSACAEQAVAQAVALANQFNASLILMHTITVYNPAQYLRPLSSFKDLYDELEASANEQLDSLINKYLSTDLKIEKILSPALSAASNIIWQATESAADLIVMGTHGRRGLGHLLLGSIAEEVVRVAACPVLTVRERATTSTTLEWKNFLVPIDFSAASREALATAQLLALKLNAKLQLVHVKELPSYSAVYPLDHISVLESTAALDQHLLTTLHQWLKDLPTLNAECHVISGHATAASSLINFARDHNSDLIVISSHGLTGTQKLLQGSVAEKVARFADCPVLNLKTFGNQLITADTE